MPLVWFMLGGLSGSLGIIIALFLFDALRDDVCPSCGGIVFCLECTPPPHHEFQGVPQSHPYPHPRSDRNVARL